MDSPRYSQAYIQHRQRGPFPGRIDPWAEAGRYFHQIHGGMIGHLLEQIQSPLEARGYIAGREASLQIMTAPVPDIHIWRSADISPTPTTTWDYALAAEQVEAAPGVVVALDEPELDALYITDDSSNELVTVVEIISPRNKTHRNEMTAYQERRYLLTRRGINVLEIDITRSIKRLLDDALAQAYPYHAAVYLPGVLPRVVGMDFDKPLHRLALPLREDVVPFEPQQAYDDAYQIARIPAHILREGRYGMDDLPFPTTLTDEQRQQALVAVDEWRTELERLQQESD